MYVTGKRKSFTVPIGSPIPYSANSYKENIIAQMGLFHAALIDVGLEQTEDTGQLASFDGIFVGEGDWTLRRDQGYRIYRVKDSLATSSPIFIRVNFVTRFHYSSSSPHIFVPSFIIGSGSSGSGSLQNASLEIETVTVALSANPSTGGVSGETFFNVGEKASYAYADEGVVWMMFGCGGVRSNQAATTARRPLITEGYPQFFFCISRPVDSSGNILPGAALITVNPSPSMMYGTGEVNGGYSYANVIPRSYAVDLMVGGTRLTSNAAARPWSDGAGTLNGGVAVGKIYMPYEVGLKSAKGIAAVSAYAVSSGSKMQLALEGLTAKTFMAPWRNLPVFEYANGTFPPVESTRIDTVLLQWDGEDV